jgi:hypothetical protein
MIPKVLFSREPPRRHKAAAIQIPKLHLRSCLFGRFNLVSSCWDAIGWFGVEQMSRYEQAFKKRNRQCPTRDTRDTQ